MNIGKRIVTSLFAASVLFSGLVLSSDSLPDEQPEIPEPKTEISTKQSGYRVKEHNGKIAVFVDGSEEPLYTLDSPYVRDLPEYDRELLKTGITADSNAKLLQILEDYDG